MIRRQRVNQRGRVMKSQPFTLAELQEAPDVDQILTRHARLLDHAAVQFPAGPSAWVLCLSLQADEVGALPREDAVAYIRATLGDQAAETLAVPDPPGSWSLIIEDLSRPATWVGKISKRAGRFVHDA
jgi:hypothetical protein